jgi:nicotinamidase-related amidase
MSTVGRELPLPSFWDPAHAADYGYAPDAQALLQRALDHRREHGIAPSGDDRRVVHLLVIDAQKDFCFPEGSLYVGGRSGRGALDDNRRLCEFIYQRLPALTHITCTLDSHLAFQIFSPSFWVGGDGLPLAAHRELTTADIASGQVRPNPAIASWLCGGDVAWLERQVADYCRELERAGRYKLYLWPPHCLLGSPGHILAGAVHEARLFHAYARQVQSWTELKGENPLTENYSVLRPEVLTRHDGRALAEKNQRLVDTLLAADVLLVAGQAASHCVKSTLDDLLVEVRERDERLAQRIHVLTDCMSAVAVPDGKGGFVADFTAQVDESLETWRAAGMKLVRAADSTSWL